MMGIKQKDENSAGGLHNTLAAGTNVKGNIITEIVVKYYYKHIEKQSAKVVETDR